MGLTIFYSGKIRSMQLLPAFEEEVIDLCRELNWKSGTFTFSPQIPLQGFKFSPPGSEPVWMTFREDGILADPILFLIKGAPDSAIIPNAHLTLFTVTQFAGMDAHIELIKILRYLSLKYFSDFHLIDESEYWETGDKEKCREWFEMFDAWMNTMSADLGKLDGRGYEGGQSIAARIDDLVGDGKSFDEILRVMGDPYRK